MDCGVAFCNFACPLGNLIPEWNALVASGKWEDAIHRLHVTNNFPEFTGRLCPALCEAACVRNLDGQGNPTAICSIEKDIANAEWELGLLVPQIPKRLSGYTVAVVGSGPAGLAAAQQLTRAGHTVAVYERDDALGGLLRYGIPDAKLSKHLIDRRLAQMEAEGTRFRPGVEVGKDVTWDNLRRRFDAIVVAIGATVPNNLPVPGRELSGIHFAMEYLKPANRDFVGLPVDSTAPHARGKHVVVIGGGDTGADCIATALKQGAASVTSLEIAPQPPVVRPQQQPWPTFPQLLGKAATADPQVTRLYSTMTLEFLGDQTRVTGLQVAAASRTPEGGFAAVPGSEQEILADLVLLATGFAGPEAETLTAELGLATTERRALQRDNDFTTANPAVFVAGDAGRGQSLVVWAIAEGRACAAAVDTYLRGSTTLPAPISATSSSLRP
jgi:glutamate synthase (NADPH/NADH) small chain